MARPAHQQTSLQEGSTAGGALRLRSGVFANGVTAAAVTQFVIDHDEAARIEDVAAYFQLEVEDIAAALRYSALHRRRMSGSGEVVPKR